MELKKEIYDENNGLTYTLVGEYYIPNLVLEPNVKIKKIYIINKILETKIKIKLRFKEKFNE